MPTKKKVTKKVAVKRPVARAHKVSHKSFKLGQEKYPFVTFKVTDQTIYWSILLILILMLGVWVVNIQINISDILNTIRV